MDDLRRNSDRQRGPAQVSLDKQKRQPDPDVGNLQPGMLIVVKVEEARNG